MTKLAEEKKRKLMEVAARKKGKPIAKGPWQKKPVPTSKPMSNFKEGKWYTLTIELVGDEMVASLTDKGAARSSKVLYLKHDGFKEKKTNFGLQAAGLNGVVSFDNLHIWEATTAKGWAAKRKKYASK